MIGAVSSMARRGESAHLRPPEARHDFIFRLRSSGIALSSGAGILGGPRMADYRLYCFGESGNAYKAALMLELCRLSWEPVKVDFFNGETRSDAYRRRRERNGRGARARA